MHACGVPTFMWVPTDKILQSTSQKFSVVFLLPVKFQRLDGLKVVLKLRKTFAIKNDIIMHSWMIIFSKRRQNFSISKRTTRITGDRAINYPQFGEVDLYIKMCCFTYLYTSYLLFMCNIYI